MRLRSSLPRLTVSSARPPDASYIRACHAEWDGDGFFLSVVGEGGEAASLDHFVRARD